MINPLEISNSNKKVKKKRTLLRRISLVSKNNLQLLKSPQKRRVKKKKENLPKRYKKMLDFKSKVSNKKN